jgi:nucleotide-binding universal stress UspA family protein
MTTVTCTPVSDRQVGSQALGEMAEALRAQGEADAERFLQRPWRQSLARERVHVLVGRGAVADQVVHWALSRAADLIVIGTPGWSGLFRWMLGSVAHHPAADRPLSRPDGRPRRPRHGGP